MSLLNTTDRQEKMITAARRAIQNIFYPSSFEKVLIVTDINSKNISQAFIDACKHLNFSVEQYLIEESMRPLKEIPQDLEFILSEKTMVFNIIQSYAQEIPFRIKWIFRVKENKKTKMGHMPGITEEMMLTSVNVDFNEMKQKAGNLLEKLNKAETLHITTKEGTDITIGIKNRIFISDIGAKEGEMCNLPCGEIYCAPLETEANGVVVFNASIGDIGLLKEPLKVFIDNGRLVKFESNDFSLINKITELTDIDADARVIGELGIGLNPGARITGRMLEDEKSLGTAHIAFGNNEDSPGGGKNRSKIHRDYLFYNPTIEVKSPGKENNLLIQEGSFIL